MWDKVRLLKGKTLSTVREKQFDIVDVSDSNVTIRIHSSGKTRILERDRLESAVALGLKGAALRPIALRQADVESFNPAYAVSIIRAIGQG